MFSTPYAARGASPYRSAGAYQQVGLQTAVSGASPHQLVSLLFDAYFSALQRARLAIVHKDVAAKGRAIGHALRIVDEGLKASLNVSAGGRLAADLADLYAYVCLRLTQANLRSDEAALAECERLMAPLRDAWTAIGPAREVAPHQ